MVRAINIEWDTDGDETVVEDLPREIDIPDEVMARLDEDEDAVSDYVSEQTGFCHYGFELVEGKRKVIEKSLKKEIHL